MYSAVVDGPARSTGEECVGVMRTESCLLYVSFVILGADSMRKSKT